MLVSLKEHSYYRTAICGFNYLPVCTRPDISFPQSSLARHSRDPTPRDMVLLKSVLRYISGMFNISLSFPRHRSFNLTSLVACVDADWGGYKATTRSATGFVIFSTDAILSELEEARRGVGQARVVPTTKIVSTLSSTTAMDTSSNISEQEGF